MSKFLLGWLMLLGLLLFMSMTLGLEPPADVILDNEQEPLSLDPLKVSYHHDIRTLTGLFEGLARLHPQTLQPEPAAAESWTISPDGRTYRFQLHRGLRWVVWHNGQVKALNEEVTAEDFAWSWQRVLAPGTLSEYYALFFCIENAERFNAGKCSWEEVGVRVLGSRTLEVRLVGPTAYFLDLCAFPSFYPVHRPTVEADPQMWHMRAGTFVCNGPYVLADRVYRRRLLLARNPYYWNADRVMLNTIELLPIESHTSSLLSYEAGYTDYVSKVPDEVARVMLARRENGREPRRDLSFTPMFRTYFYRFNCKPEIEHPLTRKMVPNPLSDARVRRALTRAVDRQALAKILGLGRPPMAGLTAIGSVRWPPDLQHPEGRLYGVPYRHDRDFNPAEARRLLDLAGYEDRKKFIPLLINYNDDELHKQVAQFVAESWQRELGLDARPNGMELATFSERQQSLRYMVSRAGWGGDYNDPMTFLEMFETGNGHNQTGWSSPDRYDAMLAQSRTEPNPAKRLEILERAERFLVLEENPILPLYQYVDAELTRPGLRGYTPNARGHMDLSYLWWDTPR